jgi:hypothetical protein
MLLINDIRWLF